MNTIRCQNCGADMPLDSVLGNQAPACPRCGHSAADDYLTTMIRKGQARPPSAPANLSSKDTDPNVFVPTMSGGVPVNQGPKPDTKFGPEYYDFLGAAQLAEELGRLGSYRVLGILGAGGMGVVYEAEDPTLQRRVALKAMLPALAVSASARQRFLREARAAAAVEHERIVPIFQVGEDRGIPFLVMPLLKGETLESRVARIGKLPIAESVRIGREIAEALAAAHERGLIHRDIKPANVWLEGLRSSVRLLDFGLARAAETSEAPLSMQGSIYGTPAFMAPEQAHGEPVDARTDLFSLGCVLYRMCSGTLPFQGPSAITILLAVVGKQPPPPAELAPEIPPALSQLVMQLLAKHPSQRPASAQAVIETLSGISVPPDLLGTDPNVALAAPPTLEDGGPSSLFMPTDAGPILSATARMPHRLGVPSAAGSAPLAGPQQAPPDADPLLSATARTPKLSGSAFPPDEGLLIDGTARVPQLPPPGSAPPPARPPARATARMPPLLPDPPAPAQRGSGSRQILVGGIGLALLVLAMAGVLLPRYWQPSTRGPDEVVEIAIAYGSEKENWFKEAVADFAAAPEGNGIKINLVRVGSVKGGQAIIAGDRVHVWSPAHTIYKAKFVQDWHVLHPGKNPILKEEALCMTPMVFVFWKERLDAFLAKYQTVSFQTLLEAMHTKNGWGDIAGRPEWGRFRFGLANPDTSNSALIGLLLLACETDRNLTLTPSDLADAGFRARLSAFKQGLAAVASSNSGLMKEMVTKGPTALDAVLTYENLAIDYLKAARHRFGDLHVAYPRRNIWNENPYYILDVPWSSPQQRQAAEKFLSFLLSTPMQQKALNHGFWPVNISIPIRDHPDSPFVRHQKNGLSLTFDSKCEVGQGAVIDELLSLWAR